MTAEEQLLFDATKWRELNKKLFRGGRGSGLVVEEYQGYYGDQKAAVGWEYELDTAAWKMVHEHRRIRRQATDIAL